MECLTNKMSRLPHSAKYGRVFQNMCVYSNTGQYILRTFFDARLSPIWNDNSNYIQVIPFVVAIDAGGTGMRNSNKSQPGAYNGRDPLVPCWFLRGYIWYIPQRSVGAGTSREAHRDCRSYPTPPIYCLSTPLAFPTAPIQLPWSFPYMILHVYSNQRTCNLFQLQNSSLFILTRGSLFQRLLLHSAHITSLIS